MKKLLLAGIAAAMLASAAPAQAHPNYDYAGGCGFNTISDGTDSPQTTWTGESSVVVVATTSGDPAVAAAVSITVECHMYIDGEFYAVINSASGTGAAANSTPGFTYQADPDSIVTVCDVVEVGGEPHTNCGDATTTPIVPEPVSDAIDVVIEQINAVIDILNENVFSQIDPTICPAMGAAAGTYGPVTIDATGDTYVDGELWWDCPPYATV